MKRKTGKWHIRQKPNFVTGQTEWETIPPRHVYSPHAEGKRSFSTYDQALAHVRNSGDRRPMVFESKTRIGQWFWLHPEGACGWEWSYPVAWANANTTVEVGA